MEFLFWLSVFGTVYSYALYPLALLMLLFLRTKHKEPRNTNRGDQLFLSLIVTVHNEESRIREKLQNSFNIDYPAEKMEIIIASDKSTDDTDNIVNSQAAENVFLVRAEERKGKEYAQWLAIQKAAGDILVFSDVATTIPADAFQIINDIFSDPAIGAVSSVDRFTSEHGEIVGEGLYVRYEMWLRRLESRIRGLVGLSGSFFAVRSSLCKEWDISVPSDFNTALNCAANGLTAVSDDRLIGVYKDVKDSKKEYERKVRTVIRGQTALLRNLRVLSFRKFGLFAFQVWSHKIMRWLVPWFILFLALTNVFVVSLHWIYILSLTTLVFFLLLVLTGAVNETARRNTAVRIPFYFFQSNLAIMHATVAFLCGKRVTFWKPSER